MTKVLLLKIKFYFFYSRKTVVYQDIFNFHPAMLLDKYKITQGKIKEEREPKYKRTAKSMKEIPFEKSPLRPHFL